MKDCVPYEGNEHIIDRIHRDPWVNVKEKVSNAIECITNEFPVGSLVYIDMTIANHTAINQKYVEFIPEVVQRLKLEQGIVVSAACWNYLPSGEIWGYNPIKISVLVGNRVVFISCLNLKTIKNYG